MSRITIDLAERITKLMLKKKKEEVQTIKNDLGDLIKDEYLKTVPLEVKELFKTNPSFLKRETYAHLTGAGFERDKIQFQEGVPATSTIWFNVPASISKKVQLLINKCKDKDDEINLLYLNIKSALLQLKTFKNVKLHFPEAGEYLPSDEKQMLPAINLDVIRNQLK